MSGSFNSSLSRTFSINCITYWHFIKIPDLIIGKILFQVSDDASELNNSKFSLFRSLLLWCWSWIAKIFAGHKMICILGAWDESFNLHLISNDSLSVAFRKQYYGRSILIEPLLRCMFWFHNRHFLRHWEIFCIIQLCEGCSFYEDDKSVWINLRWSTEKT